MTTTMRDAEPSDHAAWAPLWDAFMASQGADAGPAVARATWRRVIDPASPLKLRLALREGRIAGFATHFHQPNSWTLGDDGCLDGLFVAPDARGMGVARALIDDLLGLARLRGWHSVYWHAREDNVAARALYDRYAASDGAVRYRVPT